MYLGDEVQQVTELGNIIKMLIFMILQNIIKKSALLVS